MAWNPGPRRRTRPADLSDIPFSALPLSSSERVNLYVFRVPQTSYLHSMGSLGMASSLPDSFNVVATGSRGFLVSYLSRVTSNRTLGRFDPRQQLSKLPGCHTVRVQKLSECGSPRCCNSARPLHSNRSTLLSLPWSSPRISSLLQRHLLW